VLVVVVVVDGVQVLPVAVVGVAGMGRRLVAARGPVDVHVAAVRQVDRVAGRGTLVDMVAVGMVEMPVVEEVEMVVVDDLRMPAPAVVQVGMRGMRVVVLVG